MNFNFGEVLTRAWKIIWKHKVLWIFGILASCGQGNGGGNSGGGSRSSGGGDGFGNMPPQVLQFFQSIQDNIQTFVIIGCVLICIFWIVVAFLSTVGKIGLIRGTSQADGGAEHLVFGQLFSESMPYFWRVFGLSLIVAIPILIVMGALIAGVAVLAISAGNGNDAAGLGIAGMIPLFIGCVCLLIPVMFVVKLIIRQAERAIVLEEMPVLPSISRGWDIVRGNLGPIILMAIILAVIGFVVGFVIVIPIFIVVLPAVVAYGVGNGQSATPLAFMGVCICLYLPVIILLQGILVAYIESAWTLTFIQLTRPQENPPAVLEANA